MKESVEVSFLQRKLKMITNVPLFYYMIPYGCKGKHKKTGGHLMKSDLLTQHVSLLDHVDSWQAAIRTAAIPLLEKKIINEQYIDAMISNVIDNGPYIVIMPEVAMPHSRSEDGAFATAVSLLKLQEGVLFPQDKTVHLIIVLAAADNEAHMELLSDMVDVFMDEDKMERIWKAESIEAIKEALS